MQKLILEQHHELVVWYQAYARIQIKTRKVLRYEAQDHLMDERWFDCNTHDHLILLCGTLGHEEVADLYILLAAVYRATQLWLREQVSVVLLGLVAGGSREVQLYLSAV